MNNNKTNSTAPIFVNKINILYGITFSYDNTLMFTLIFRVVDWSSVFTCSID